MRKEFKLLDPYESELYTYLWTVEDPKGVVQIIHGMSEHVGRYDHFAQYLNSLGLIVIGNDHLGHGRTSTDLSCVHFDDNGGFHKVYEGVKTVRDYIDVKYPDLPVIMFAHSMGSFIGRYAILYDHERYNQAIFSGTGWFSTSSIYFGIFVANLITLFKGKRHVSPFFNQKLMSGAQNSMIRRGLINRPIEWLTNDKDVQKEFEESPLCGQPFTITAQKDLLQFMLDIQDKKKIRASASSTPLFFISGEQDGLGKYGQSIRKLSKLYNHCGYSNVKFKVVDNCRHEIINELRKKDIFEDLGDWILRYL